ncbi:MAG: hypothetical protein EOM66_12555, partial [Clostridia bacterium]|nr:hypothetical protein [Clostridia bacterium]
MQQEYRLIINAGKLNQRYLQDLWVYRELFLFLAWRDILVRYKQTIIGIAWSVVRPLMTLVVFTIVFGKFAKLPSGNVPYVLLVMVGTLPWQFFANTVSEGGNSLIDNERLVSKVYFPRIIIPSTSMIVSLIDFMISLGIMAVIMLWYRFLPGWHIVFLPVLLAFAAMTALFRFQGLAEAEARRQAVREFDRLQPGLSGAEAVIFFTSKVSNSFTAIPASRLLAHLREQQALSADLAEFLRRAVYALTWTPLCHDPEQHASPWSLAEQPDIPPPKALREFFPRPPLDEDGYLEDYAADFEAWRKAIRSDAFRLAQVLVEP